MILADSSHPIFEFAFEQLIYRDENEVILEVIKRSLHAKLDFFVKAMFNQRISCTGWLMPNVWKLIIQELKNQNKMNVFFEFFVKLGPAVVDNGEEFFSWLVDTNVAEQSLMKFPEEYTVIKYALEIFKVHDLSRGSMEGERKKMEMKLAELTTAMLVELDQAKLKIFWVYDVVESALNVQSFSDEDVFEKIKILRREALDHREKTRELYRYSIASITDWNVVNVENRNTHQT